MPKIHSYIRQHSSPTRGVTLIEVLVAIVILSIGLLGIAGLQVATTKFKLGSQSRAATASLYADYADLARLNPDMLGKSWVSGGRLTAVPDHAGYSSLYAFPAFSDTAAYASNPDALAITFPTGSTWAAQQAISDTTLQTQINAVACEGSTAVCIPADRATYDMLTWRQRVRNSLPQGAVFVTGDRSTGVVVTLMWMDKDNTDRTASTNDGTSATQPNLVLATQCSTVASTNFGLARQTCCPDAAAAPAGVRCNRFSFMP
ncbi:type IV pilus assembly protein PilV [Rhodoferax ferrireducens]|uniref:Type IV pilus assembly protein PilV n=1 Tax=Rhodoferax ferrireducens TaxID=192843 RepID=A0ABU2C7Z4_9BURK|nr:prepilin-type N-terminal cleavage/methylation domain-containing protein [Rhodoferax ferrireducens]MDR7377404.1 type IV pilus assembly protein PilV [Rhodoferax ferrireducens]